VKSIGCVLCLDCFSGGIELEIRGNNFNLIKKPQFVVYINDQNRTGVWLSTEVTDLHIWIHIWIHTNGYIYG